MKGLPAPKLKLTRDQINLIRANLGLSTLEELEQTRSHKPKAAQELNKKMFSKKPKPKSEY